MRDSYLLDITKLDKEEGYLVEVSESGVIKGDGIAGTKREAILEALREAGVL